MAEPQRGTLVWKPGQGADPTPRPYLCFQSKKGNPAESEVKDRAQLAPSLKAPSDTEQAVDFDDHGGRKVRIRPAGEAWAGSTAPPPPPVQQKAQSRGPTGPGRHAAGAGRNTDRARPSQRPPAAFHNPYNFIPAVPPAMGTEGAYATGIEQGAPKGHDRYHEDRWTGRIRIGLEAVTPMLIPDAGSAETRSDGHKTFDLRTGRGGGPYLPPTSLKGALRAAYEAITNSRLAVFTGHEDRLAHRMEARGGLSVVPARVTDDGDGIELWLGDRREVTAKPATMYAAWLPRYVPRRGGLDRHAVRYPDGELPAHRDAVTCWLQLYEYVRGFYWRVIAIGRKGRDALPKPQPSRWGSRNHRPVGGEPLLRVDGHVCVTNQNIGGKHDERVFFTTPDQRPRRVAADMEDLGKAWRELIANYQKTHEDDLKKRKEPPDRFLGHEPGKTAWSRHVYTPEDRELEAGTLCYAKMDGNAVVALYPVMISRELADVPPSALLPPELLPAKLEPAAKGDVTTHAQRFRQLSPADRVFGWASQAGDGAWRGQLRIGPITCETAVERAIDRFADPLPLAILSTPKPQQARFYVGKDKEGTPQADHLSKAEAAYAAHKGLRGRKVYPHPAYLDRAGLAETYWDPQAAGKEPPAQPQALTAGGQTVYREYRRRAKSPDELRDDQNRSIKAWVRPGTRFSTWIDVVNLDDAELGALLWLLSLPDDPTVKGDPVLRLGGGKPLGFGSTRVRLEGLDLANGSGKRAEYLSFLLAPDPATAADGDRCRIDAATAGGTDAVRAAAERFIEPFREAIGTAYAQHPAGFADVAFIKAFLAAACGPEDDLPIHYPRAAERPDPEGKNFEWFTRNEQTGRDAPAGNRVGLAALADGEGLPLWPEPAPRGGWSGGRR